MHLKHLNEIKCITKNYQTKCFEYNEMHIIVLINANFMLKLFIAKSTG